MRVKDLIRRLMATPSSAGALVLRCALGVVILAHGLQKVFGWFDGGGLDGAMQYLSGKGIPYPLAVLVIGTESLGAAALVAGLFTRLAALAIGCEMLVAALLVHLSRGFFMDWHSAHHGEGYEFHILACAMASSLVLSGGGAFSLDRFLLRATAGPRPR